MKSEIEFLKKIQNLMRETEEDLCEEAKEVEIGRIKDMDVDEFKEYVGLDVAYQMQIKVDFGETELNIKEGNAHPTLEFLYSDEQVEEMEKLFKKKLPEFISENLIKILGEEDVKVVKVKDIKN